MICSEIFDFRHLQVVGAIGQRYIRFAHANPTEGFFPNYVFNNSRTNPRLPKREGIEAKIIELQPDKKITNAVKDFLTTLENAHQQAKYSKLVFGYF